MTPPNQNLSPLSQPGGVPKDFKPSDYLLPRSDRESILADFRTGIPVVAKAADCRGLVRLEDVNSVIDRLRGLEPRWLQVLQNIRVAVLESCSRFPDLAPIFQSDSIVIPKFFGERDKQIVDGLPSRVMFFSLSQRGFILSISDFIERAHQMNSEFSNNEGELSKAIDVWVATYGEFVYHEWGHIAAKNGFFVPRDKEEFQELMSWRNGFLADYNFSTLEMDAFHALEQDGLAEAYRAALPRGGRSVEVFGADRVERLIGSPDSPREPPPISRETVIRLATLLPIIRRCGPQALLPFTRETFKSWIQDGNPELTGLFNMALAYGENFLNAHSLVGPHGLP